MSVPAVRSTKNRQIEELDNGAHRDRPFNAPANETANARVELIGPLRHANLAIDLSAVALTAGGVDADAPTTVMAHSSGKILGFSYKFSGSRLGGRRDRGPAAGGRRPGGRDPVVQGDVKAIASGASAAPVGVFDRAEVTFAKGDAVGMVVTTSHTFAATTDDLDCYLIVRWDASPGVPA